MAPPLRLKEIAMPKTQPKTHTLPAWRIEVVFALVAMMLTMLLFALSYGRAWPLSIDIGGGHDLRFINRITPQQTSQGFHAVEPFGANQARWTSGDASVYLPRPADNSSSVLSLRLLNSRPGDLPAPILRLSLDGKAVASFEVPKTENGMRNYSILAPVGNQLSWASELKLETEAVSPAGDPRQLGVVLDSVSIKPLRWALPSAWLTLMAIGLGLVSYSFPRMLGISRRAALALAALMALLVAWGIAARPLELLPFVQRIVALLALAIMGLALALRMRGGAWRDLRVQGSDVPLFMAIAWWLGPLFQAVITADGAEGVSPPVPTVWIGIVLAVALLIATAWYRLRAADAPKLPYKSMALGLFASAALAHLVYMLWFAFTRSGPDFWILFKGVRDWARGGSLYDLHAVTTNHFGHVFKVPPFYGMFFLPFVFQDGLRILLFHRIMNVIMLSITALVWMRMWNIRAASIMGLSVFLLLNFRPIADTIAFGQIDIVLILLLTLALWCLRNERNILAGMLIAMGTLFKIYPILLLAFLVAKLNWKGLWGFVLGMLLYNGISLAVFGWEMHWIYVTQVLTNIGGTTAQDQNQTIMAFVARFVESPNSATIFEQSAYTKPAFLLSAFLGLMACIISLKDCAPKTTAYGLQYSQFLLAMVFLAPAAWMHYEVLLIIPFGILLLRWQDRELPLWYVLLFAASYALIAYGNQYSYYTGTVMGILTVIGASYKFYGMVALAFIMVREILSEREPLAIPRWFPMPAVVQRYLPIKTV